VENDGQKSNRGIRVCFCDSLKFVGWSGRRSAPPILKFIMIHMVRDPMKIAKEKIIDIVDYLSPLFSTCIIFLFLLIAPSHYSGGVIIGFMLLGLIATPCKHRIFKITSWGGLGCFFGLTIALLTIDQPYLCIFYVFFYFYFGFPGILHLSLLLAVPSYFLCRRKRYEEGKRTFLARIYHEG